MKDAILKMRLTADEKTFIRTQAEAAGLPVSAYLRALALGNTIQTKTDVVVLNELRRLGGLCKHLFANGADQAVTGSALKELEAAAARLAPR